MYLILILLWCWVEVRTLLPIIPGSADLIPDWRHKFPFDLLREGAHSLLIRANIFAAVPRFRDEDRQNSRLNGNNPELSPAAGRAPR
jgi:hypothetical protein